MLILILFLLAFPLQEGFGDLKGPVNLVDKNKKVHVQDRLEGTRKELIKNSCDTKKKVHLLRDQVAKMHTKFSGLGISSRIVEQALHNNNKKTWDAKILPKNAVGNGSLNVNQKIEERKLDGSNSFKSNEMSVKEMEQYLINKMVVEPILKNTFPDAYSAMSGLSVGIFKQKP